MASRVKEQWSRKAASEAYGNLRRSSCLLRQGVGDIPGAIVSRTAIIEHYLLYSALLAGMERRPLIASSNPESALETMLKNELTDSWVFYRVFNSAAEAGVEIEKARKEMF